MNSGRNPESDILQQLQESQDRLRIALECANIGVFDWDVITDEVIYFHPSSTTPSGELIESHVTGSSWFTTTHPDDIASARDQVDRAIRGEADRFSIRYRMMMGGDRDDDWTVVHSRGQVRERDSSGRATRILGAYEDVTSNVAREEYDRKRDEDLARSIRIASMGELASSLAHEINQPLAALTTYLQASVRAVNQKSITPGELVRILKCSERQASLVAEIVRRLRNLYRTGHAADEKFDFMERLNNVINLLRRDIEKHRIEIKVSSRMKRVMLTGDRLQVEQVLYNLMRNSVDALQHQAAATGEICIAVGVQSGRCRVTIRDNGPGIPDHVRSRLFEPFFTTKPNGTGLGLSISRTIVEAHRGRIQHDVRQKRGTRFILELPVSTGGK